MLTIERLSQVRPLLGHPGRSEAEIRGRETQAQDQWLHLSADLMAPRSRLALRLAGMTRGEAHGLGDERKRSLPTVCAE
ncbi:hypothetical protein ACSSV1_001151 [Labrenzia sp. MBR-25]